jgi:hypothetical protein
MSEDSKLDKISRDVVYQQLYQEMRRYRDYEIVVSGWYITLTLGVIGGLFAISKLNINVGSCLVWLFSTFFVIAGLGISYVIWYAHDRYRSLRDYTDKNIEPAWKDKPKIRETWFQPYIVLILVNLMLTAGVVIAFIITAKTS